MHIDTTLSHTDAQRAIAAIQAELERRGKVAVITVADSHGELIALLRMDGAPLASVTIAINKAFTAAREGKPTLDIGAKFRDKGYDFAWFGDPRYLGWGGGVPVIHEGKCAGAVAVSGLTQQEDHELAQVGVAAVGGSGYFERPELRLHYRRMGAGDPMLLLHGVTDNAAYWGWTARELAKRYQVFGLDQRGHGLSDAPASGYTMRDYVTDAASFVEQAIGKPAVVIGHSFGASVAFRLAAEHPELVRALVLEDPPFRNLKPVHPSAEQADELRWQWFEWLRACRRLTHPQLVERAHHEHPGWSDEDCQHWATSKAQVRDRITQPGGIEFGAAWSEAIAKVTGPVLLLYGDQERGSLVGKDQAAAIAELMPNCQTVHVAGAGHAIHREQREVMLNAVLTFLATLRLPIASDLGNP
jgi:pimeloyl-ACP methyl ester carboxylesterase/uncharacterized protein GlcG (DUF336 family)